MRQFGRFGPLVGSIDESTSSARFMVFAANTSEMLTYHHISVKTYHPGEGWAEQDPLEIWHAVLECIEVTIDNLRKLDINPGDIVAIGIANQRETVIMWDYKTGFPLHNAILWMDTRADSIVEELKKNGTKLSRWVQDTCGLPLSPCWGGPKLSWLLKRSPRVQTAVKEGACMAGTVDSWLIWNLTGGSNGGMHVTDVTNASRTMLMDLQTLQWDTRLCRLLGLPVHMLPSIRSSSEVYGYIVSGSLTGVPISGCLGDQQAALLGQNCIEFGQAECTFGQGTFLLYNTGTSIVRSQNGLITTVAYKMGHDAPTVYALEGSVGNTGTALGWLYSGLGLRDDEEDKESDTSGDGSEGEAPLLPRTERPGRELLQRLGSQPAHENNTDEVLFVPAFAGLLAPYWRRDAGSVLCGITGSTTAGEVLRGALRCCGLQTRALLEALERDMQRPLPSTLLGSGALGAPALLQQQADCTGIPIVRSHQAECWALGAAMAAGSAAGINVWPQHPPPSPSDTFYPTTTLDEREMMYVKWQMAIERSLGWTSVTASSEKEQNLQESKKNPVYSSIPAGIFVMSSCLLLLLASKVNY